MQAVVIYLTKTPAPEVPAIYRSTLPPRDFLISFSLTSSLKTFFFGLSAVAPSPLAPGPSSPGPAAPQHPAPVLNLLDLQLLDHGFPAPWSPNPGPQLLPLGLEEGQDNI